MGIKPVEYTFIPTEEIEKVINNAENIQKEDFEKVLKSYRVDYIVWDSVKNPEWKLNRFSFLKQLYSTSGIIIYTFK